MTTKDRPYIIANQEGIKISQVYEQGFDSTKFEGNYYEVNDILNHPTEYDTYKGEVMPGATTLTSVTLNNPTVSKNLIKVGNENIDGFFSEKPVLQKIEGAYYFPLGSQGVRAFEYSSFLDSDKNLNINISDGDRQSVNSISCQDTFSSNSGYDTDCFYDFEGAQIVASNSIGKNLLKFEEDTSKKSSSTTLKLLKGDIIQYTPELNENEILSVKITVNGEDYTDFAVYDEGTIKGNTPLEKDAEVVIKLTFHNFFRLKDSSGTYRNYSLLYYSTGEKDQTSEGNFLGARDQVSLNSNNTVMGRFKAPITINSSGGYYISLYAKCEDFSTLNLYGPYFVEEAHYTTNFESGVIPYINKLDTPVQYNEEGVKTIKGFSSTNAGNCSNIVGSLITPTWKRVTNKIHLELAKDAEGKDISTNYEVCFFTTKASGSSNYKHPSHKFMGLKVEKDLLSPYDYRNVNYTLIPNNNCGFISKNSHVLYFDFSKISSAIASNSAWAISYLRKFDGSPSEEHLDSIGSTNFGYSGSSIVANGTSQKLTNKVENHLNRWERVIITHASGASVVNIEVISSGDYNLGVTSDSYKMTAKVGSFTEVMPGIDKTLSGSSTGNYNLILGGSVSEGKVTTYNGTYRGLWFFSKGLTDTEILALKKQFMVVSMVPRNSKDSKEIVLRSEFLQEESTY